MSNSKRKQKKDTDGVGVKSLRLHKLDKDGYCIFCGIYKPDKKKCPYPEAT